jgi:hypothetical protein
VTGREGACDMAVNSSEPDVGPVTGWASLVVLAGVLLAVAGGFTVIQAIYALTGHLFAAADGQGLVLDLTTWGWLHLVLGALQLLVGLAVLQGATWARATAAVVVGLGAISQMMFLPTYPVWSALLIALDVLIVWALCMHGTEVQNV